MFIRFYFIIDLGGSLLNYLRKNSNNLTTRQQMGMCRDAAAGKFLKNYNFPLNFSLVKDTLAKVYFKVNFILFSLLQLTDKIMLKNVSSAGVMSTTLLIKQIFFKRSGNDELLYFCCILLSFFIFEVAIMKIV